MAQPNQTDPTTTLYWLTTSDWVIVASDVKEYHLGVFWFEQVATDWSVDRAE